MPTPVTSKPIGPKLLAAQTKMAMSHRLETASNLRRARARPAVCRLLLLAQSHRQRLSPRLSRLCAQHPVRTPAQPPLPLAASTTTTLRFWSYCSRVWGLSVWICRPSRRRPSQISRQRVCYGDDWMRLGEYSTESSMLEFSVLPFMCCHIFAYLAAIRICVDFGRSFFLIASHDTQCLLSFPFLPFL